MRKLVPPFAALCIGLLLLSSGCAPKKVKVTGRLLKNGVPQTFAENEYVTVTFRPEKAEDDAIGADSFPAKLDRPAGTYEVELPPGRYFVNVFVPPKAMPGSNKPQGPPPVGNRQAGDLHEIKASMALDLTVP